MVAVTAVVEGLLDEAVVTRLVRDSGAEIAHVHVKRGKAHILGRLHGYDAASRISPWLVLVDLDADFNCAPEMKATHLPRPGAQMCFRIAVRELEAWLLGDADRLAQFLGILPATIPRSPEALADPKAEMVRLATRSKRREIRLGLVPRPESGRTEGPTYTSRLGEFVMDAATGWRPEVAAGRCDSLRRAIACLRRLAAR